MNEFVTLIYDNETGTVLAVEGCSILVCTPEDAESLSAGTLDMETFRPEDSMSAERALRLRDAAEILVLGAQVVPDPRMGGTTDCYAVALDDKDALREALGFDER